MRKSGWIIIPAAFFLFLNFSRSTVQIHFVQRLVYFLFLLFLFLFLRKIQLGKIIRALVGGIGSIVFLYGIAQKLILFPYHLSQFKGGSDQYVLSMITRLETGRIYSIFALPTLYAIICVVLIIFTFHYLFTTPKEKPLLKIGWAFLLALGLVNLALTQSFGGIVCLLVGGFIYIIVSGILKFKYLAPVLMVMALFFSVTVGLRFQEASNLAPIKLRYSNWAQAGRMIASSPFWGVGLGNYENRVSYHTLSSEAKSIYAHNFFLQFFAETGLVFTFFLLLLMWNTRRKWWPSLEHCRTHIEYATVIAVLLVYNFIDIGIYFFASGIIAAVALSQLYPCMYRKRFHEEPESPFRRNVIAVSLTVLAILLAFDYYTDSKRTEGDLLISQGKITEAADNYRSAFQLNPFNYKAMVGFAAIRLSGSRPDEAEPLLEQAITLYPDIAPAHFLISRIRFQEKRLFNAFFHASRAVKKNPLSEQYRKWYEYLEMNLQKIVDRSREKNGKGETK